MAELRGGRDEPDGGDIPEHRYQADAGDGVAEARPRAEPSPRAEYADVIREKTGQENVGKAQADRGNADQAEADPDDASQADADQEDADKADAGQEDARQAIADQEHMGQADADRENTDQACADQTETDRSTEGSIADALERFDPRRAGLPEVSRAEAAAYINEHLADRPWLAAVRDCSPDVQRVFVALDQGRGHAHIRHDSWVTEEMNERRVRNLEDPAQLDPEKREAHLDGLKAGNQPHWCGSIATRITSPEIFAAAFVRGTEHPEVRTALDSTDPIPPGPVVVPLSDLLGPDGHIFCSGSQLEPVDGSMMKARTERDVWATGSHSGPEPEIRPVETFEGGTVTFTFRPSPLGGHEVNTMYVNPPAN
jgi:hypothetical protein